MPNFSDIKKKIKERIRDSPLNKNRHLPDAHELTESLQKKDVAKQKESNVKKQEIMKQELGEIKSDEKKKAAKDYWVKVNENIERRLQGGSEAYVEWSTGMNQIAATLMDLVKALNASIGLCELPAPTWSKDEPDQLNFSPKVNYSIKMDDTGHLTTAVHSGGKPVDAHEKMLFDQTLAAWGKVQGYSLENTRQGPVFRKDDPTNNVLMTKAEFDKLKKDPDNGLHSFLEKKFNLELTESNSLTP